MGLYQVIEWYFGVKCEKYLLLRQSMNCSSLSHPSLAGHSFWLLFALFVVVSALDAVADSRRQAVRVVLKQCLLTPTGNH